MDMGNYCTSINVKENSYFYCISLGIQRELMFLIPTSDYNFMLLLIISSSLILFQIVPFFEMCANHLHKNENVGGFY